MWGKQGQLKWSKVRLTVVEKLKILLSKGWFKYIKVQQSRSCPKMEKILQKYYILKIETQEKRLKSVEKELLLVNFT